MVIWRQRLETCPEKGVVGTYRVRESLGMDKLIQADFKQEVLRLSATKHWHLQVK